jgi:hypothetical protein
MAKHKGNAGGAALQGGAGHQNRVGAWLGVEMLAEGSGGPLTSGGKVRFIRGETQEDVDDLLVGSSSDRYAFLQAKRRISLSDRRTSDFASVVDQAVRQFIGSRSGSARQPWSRPLNPGDRIVLVTSSSSGATIREALRQLLRRLAGLSPGQTLASAALNATERKALKALRVNAVRSWKAEAAASPTEQELRDLFSVMAVETLDVAENQVHMREAKKTLEQVVLENPAQSGVAWTTIIDACTAMAEERTGLDLAALQKKLLDNGIALRSLPSYRADIERLCGLTNLTVGWLRDLSQIQLGGKAVHLERRVISELRQAVEKGSHIVVGQPGAGKSGGLHDLVHLLQQGGADVVCLATDRLEISSLFNLKAEIGLDHEITDVLKNWQGPKPGYVVIDAVDAARGDAAEQAVLSLIRTMVGVNTRWRVVASIRKFDLRYSTELQQLFRRSVDAGISAEFLDPEFPQVQHINIPCLRSDEIDALRIEAPALHRVYESASDEFRELLRVPFNLRLASDLLGSGVRQDELAPIRTQLELLSRYWLHRVVQRHGGDDREAILRRTVEAMVHTRQLRVDRSIARASSPSAALEQLLSSHVLAEWQPAPAIDPDRYSLAFTHNLLFDYAGSQLLLPRSPDDLIALLVKDQDLVLVVRPSIVFVCQALWERDRNEFWKLVLSFCAAATFSQMIQSIPLLVVASNAKIIDDVQPLISALESHRPGADCALRHLVGALRSRPKLPLPLAGPTSGPWSELVNEVTKCLTGRRIAHAQGLVELLLQEQDLTWDQRQLVGAAARRILKVALNGF